MQFEKANNKGQARLFKSPLLEALTKTHPILIWGMYIPIMAWMMWKANTQFGFTQFQLFYYWLAGLACWTLFEYFFHRYVFHHLPETDLGKKINYILHGNHHHYPRDKQRLLMPPIPSLILSGSIFGILYLILGNAAFSFFPGFLVGYLIYGTMHYAIHAYNPPFKFMKPLWRNHHLHHYKNQSKGYGVSTTLWDRVFGTMWDLKKEKEDRDKVKALMFD